MGYELLGIELDRHGHTSILKVYIDKDKGVTINDCVLVSQQLTALLDVENPIRGDYQLEVSSPGLDRLIFTVEQLKCYIGEAMELRLHRKDRNRKRYIGLLVSVDEDAVVMHCDDQDIEIPCELIKKARLVSQL